MKQYIKYIYWSLLGLLIPTISFAQEEEIINPLKRWDTLGGFFVWIFQIQLGFAGILAFIGIIFSGYQLLTAGGDAESVTKAKHRLVWSVIGLILVITAGSIIRILVNTLQGTTL